MGIPARREQCYSTSHGVDEMKKARANAAKLAAKRHKASLRRKNASGEIRLELNWEYIAAAWLTTKPKSERWELLERYATRVELIDAIRQDTASHEAMLDLISRDPALLPAKQTSQSSKCRFGECSDPWLADHGGEAINDAGGGHFEPIQI
jgi:hypothetical protein